ncbi:hypothetical protein BJY52DRAFT_1278601 [Lactarius psammicola]|nr:hypothetical protein BJY52DRAFT_1278601 [Lactarius psammicola]
MSFMSEPQSRVVLEGHSHRLLAEFDTQLKIIADRYLAFFQQRRRIEVTYISSLLKLYHDTSSVDASFDPTPAWNKIRDNLERGMCPHILVC